MFTTLHTNDAPSAVTRMRDMGLPTFLITATVEAVLAQRLVRKLCANCRTEFMPPPESIMELGYTAEEAASKKFYYGRGCEKCNNTGYKGRMGLFELLIMNDHLRELVIPGGLARRVPQRRSQERHAHPPRGGPPGHPRRLLFHRGSRSRNDAR